MTLNNVWEHLLLWQCRCPGQIRKNRHDFSWFERLTCNLCVWIHMDSRPQANSGGFKRIRDRISSLNYQTHTRCYNLYRRNFSVKFKATLKRRQKFLFIIQTFLFIRNMILNHQEKPGASLPALESQGKESLTHNCRMLNSLSLENHNNISVWIKQASN